MLNFLRLVCNIAERIMYAVLVLMVALILLSTLQGCSVNVVVAPGATLSVDSDLSRNAAVQRYTGPGYNPNAMAEACAEYPQMLICDRE